MVARGISWERRHPCRLLSLSRIPRRCRQGGRRSQEPPLYSPRMERRAKIMATLGPVSRGETVLRELIRAGVDLFRLNLSHGTQEQHRETLRLVRRIAGEEGCHLPVVLDLMGPRYRLGQIPDEPRLLEPNQEVVLGTESPGVDLPV